MVEGLAPDDPMHASLDHIVPRSQGGTNDLDNYRLVHHRCNHERDVREGRAGTSPSA